MTYPLIVKKEKHMKPFFLVISIYLFIYFCYKNNKYMRKKNKTITCTNHSGLYIIERREILLYSKPGRAEVYLHLFCILNYH